MLPVEYKKNIRMLWNLFMFYWVIFDMDLHQYKAGIRIRNKLFWIRQNGTIVFKPPPEIFPLQQSAGFLV